MGKILLILLFIAIFFVLGFVGSSLEAKDFNNGICKNCGNQLRYFDTDSQGGRGYICRRCGYTTWVSYNRVDKNLRSKKDGKFNSNQ